MHFNNLSIKLTMLKAHINNILDVNINLKKKISRNIK